MVEDETDDGVHTHGILRFAIEDLFMPGDEVGHVAGIGAFGAGRGAGGEQGLVVGLQCALSFHGNRIPWGRASARRYKVVRTTSDQ